MILANSTHLPKHPFPPTSSYMRMTHILSCQAFVSAAVVTGSSQLWTAELRIVMDATIARGA